jgi:hypothetical protein
MSEQKEEHVIGLIVKGVMRIVDENKDYAADHENKYPPAYFRVFKKIGPFKRTLLKVYPGKDKIEIEKSKYITDEQLDRAFSELKSKISIL